MMIMSFLWSTAPSCGDLSTRHGTFGVGLKKDHKNYKRVEAPLLWGQASSVEIVQPYCGLTVAFLERGLEEGWGHIF